MKILILLALMTFGSLAMANLVRPTNGQCPTGYNLGKNGHWCFEEGGFEGRVYNAAEGCPAGYSPGTNGQLCFPDREAASTPAPQTCQPGTFGCDFEGHPY